MLPTVLTLLAGLQSVAFATTAIAKALSTRIVTSAWAFCFQGFPSDQLTQLATDRGSGTSGILLELAALNKGVVDEIIPEFYSKGLLTQAMKYTPLEVYHAVNV